MKKLCLLLLWLFSAIPSQAAIITVNSDRSGDYPTIQSAIDAAVNGDIIELQTGTYRGDGNYDIDFIGKAITVRSTNPNDWPVVESTVIDCRGMGRGFYFHSDENERSCIEGITITNGSGPDGAGIYCTNASPSIRSCRLINGIAEEWGGGIYCYESSPLIFNCIFTGNSAFEGAAISAYSDWGYLCAPRIQNCRIFGNSASGSGGGINCDCLSSPIISNCLIYNNYAGTNGGGGISIFQSNPTITGCTIVNNAVYSAGCGILQWYEFENGSTLKNCIIWENTFALDPENPFGGPPGPQITLGSTMSVSYCDIEEMWIETLPGAILNMGDGIFFEFPFFVDAAGHDYHLLLGSMCIDTGDPGYIPGTGETELDGQPRRMGTFVDIGAYEFPGPIYEPRPYLEISSAEFNYDANEARENPPAQTLSISNIGIGTLTWEIFNDCPWLTISPLSGEVTGETQDVTLSVDISGLSPGQYDYIFAVSAEGADNSPQFVIVHLTVNGPRIDLSAANLEFSLSGGIVTPLLHSFTIANGAGGTLNWNINYDCNWIDVEPVSGTSVGEVTEITVLPGDMNSFTIPGHYICALTVSSDGASNNPQTVHIILHVEGALLVPDDYPTIQSAIDASMDGDTIDVSPGTYTGIGNRDLDLRGKAIIVKSIDPDDPCVVENTIIDCQGSAADPHRGFRLNSGETRDSIVSGFMITNGYGPDETHQGGTSSVGGAICCFNSSPTISKCKFESNAAATMGGAIYGNNSSLIISQCIFRNNSAGGVYDYHGGGAIHVRIGSPSISSSIIINSSTGVGKGGGIHFMGCTSFIIDNCVIADNSAGRDGGGIYCSATLGNSKISNCTLSKNSAGIAGGGVMYYNNYNSLQVKNCILWSNTASSTGAQLYSNKGVDIVSAYSDIQGGFSGTGNLNTDPFFADQNNHDYHLKSHLGRWDPIAEMWVHDNDTSPCIDAGDPTSDWTKELWPNGKRINMGAYGGTPQASMSLSSVGNIANLDNDPGDTVDLNDLAIFVDKWCFEEYLLAEDLDRDGHVDFKDFAIISNEFKK